MDSTLDTPNDSQLRPSVGLLAAWGDFPLMVARRLRDDGYRVVGLGVRDHCDPALAELCDHFEWTGVARLGRAVRYFRRHRVTQATMAGKIHKVILYKPWAWFRHRPDWTTIRTFFPHFVSGKRDRKDDTLLTAIVDCFAEGGITFLPATDFAPELLVEPGNLAGKPLTRAQIADVAFGWNAAKQMGHLDIGQSVCVKSQTVIAVEAIEGTDLCISRAGSLCRQGGFTVVKVAKPRQDMRFDVPTVGIGTLRSMAEAGGSVLAIEAGRTILLDPSQFCQFAAQNKISVVSVDGAALEIRHAA